MKKGFNKILHLLMRNVPGNKNRVKILRKLGARVGNRIFIGQNLLIFDAGRTDLFTIENNSAIGPNVTILIHSDPWPTTLTEDYPKTWKPVKIESNVLIGACATIMGGVTIAHDSIVGAGALVTKDVPPYTIVAGVPAKKLRDVKK